MTDSATLRKSTFLCSLHIKMYTGRKLDKKATKQTQDANNAQPDSGSFSKRLLSRDALKNINTAVSAAREYFRIHTMPWANDGRRILPASMRAEFMDRLDELKDDYWRAVEEFINRYDHHREAQREVLGNLYDEKEYLEIDKLRKKYDFDVEIDTIPDAEDFRVDMSDEDRAKLEKNIEQRIEAAKARTDQELFERLLKPVQKMAEKLKDNENPIFRDSLVKNIEKIVSMIPVYNITGNTKIADMANRIENDLLCVSPQDLRDDVALKSNVADKAQAIYDDLQSILGPMDEDEIRKAA